MNRIPATLGAARQFSTSRAAQQHAITQSARGRWWGPAQATTGAVSSSSPVSPWATVVDTSNIMVSNLKTLESNPFAAAVSKQAPNRAATWSSSQRPRADAIRGARFEQTDLAAQVRLSRNLLYFISNTQLLFFSAFRTVGGGNDCRGTDSPRSRKQGVV